MLSQCEEGSSHGWPLNLLAMALGREEPQGRDFVDLLEGRTREACLVPAVQEAETEKHVHPEVQDQCRSHSKTLSQKSKERTWPRVMESCPSPGGLPSCSVLPGAVLEAGPAVGQYLLPVEAAPGLTLEATGQSPSELSHYSFWSDTVMCRSGPRAVVCGQQASVVIPNLEVGTLMSRAATLKHDFCFFVSYKQ